MVHRMLVASVRQPVIPLSSYAEPDRASQAHVRDCLTTQCFGVSAQYVRLSPGRHMLGLRSMPSMRMPYSFKSRNTWL